MARHWLLRVDFAGRSYLWSDAPVTPVDTDGRAWPHLGGLPELRVPSDYDPFRLSPSVQSVSVEVNWPTDDPIGAIIAAGHRLPDAYAEVSVWSDGNNYDDRVVLVYGNPSEPQYGEPGQPVAFSVEGRPWVDKGSTHLDTQRVTEDTWPNGDADSTPWYPVVIGRPGWSTTITGGFSAASEQATPCRIAERAAGSITRLIIAGHAVEAPTVTISDGTAVEVFNVEHVQDGVGQVVASVDISAAATISKTASSYTCRWSGGGGHVGPGGYLSGGGDVILWALERMQLPTDYGRVRAARRYLNRFTLSGYIDEPVSPWDWIQDALLDTLLPVTAVVRGGRLRLIVWRYDAVAVDAVRTITVEPGVTAPSRSTFERSNIRSRYVLACAPDENGDPAVTLGIGPRALGDRRTTGTRFAAVADTIVGDVLDSKESLWVGNIETAYLSMHWRCVRDLSAQYVEVQDISGEFDELEDGDLVKVTHSDAGISDRLGLVARDLLSPVAQTIRVLMLPAA